MITAFILPENIINIILFMGKKWPNPIGYGWATGSEIISYFLGGKNGLIH